MATELARAYVQIIPSAKGITANLEKELAPLAKAGDDAGNKAGKGFAASFEKATGATLESFGKKALVGAAALSAGLFGAAKAAGSLEAAIAANEQVLGSASAAVQEWAKDSVQNVGLSERAALEAATAFGQLAKVAGLSGPAVSDFAKQFVTLAADMAAFKDVPVGQALADLQSAFAGQTEVVRKYGIFLDEASLKNAYFQETGEKVSGTLTAQQRVLATQAAIMASTGDIQGQAARESESLARQTDNLKAEFENMAASVGKSVLPAVTSMVGLAGKAIGAFGSLNDATGGLVGTIAGFGAAGLGAVGSFALVASKASGLITSFREMGTFGRSAAAGMGVLALAMIPLAIGAQRAAGRQRELAEAIDSANRATDATIINEYENAVNRAFIETKDFGEAHAQVARDAYGAAVRILELEDATGALTEQNMAWGLTAEQAADKVDLLRTAVANEAEAQEASAASSAAAQAGMAGVGDTAAETGADITALVDDLGTAETGFGRAARAVPSFADQLGDLRSDADRAADAIDGLASAIGDTLGSSMVDVQSSGDALIQKFRETDEAVLRAIDGQEGYSLSLEGTSEAAIENRARIADTAAGIEDYITSLARSGATTGQVQTEYAGLRQQLVDQLLQFGYTEDAANEYVNQLGLTPDSVTTAIELQNQQTAKAEVEDYINNKLGRIPASKLTEIQAAINQGDYEAAESALRTLTRDRFARVFVQSNAASGVPIKGVLGTGAFLPGGDAGIYQIAEVPGSRGDELVAPLGRPALLDRLVSLPQVYGRLAASMARVAPGGDGGMNGPLIGQVVNNRRDITPNDLAQMIRIAQLEMA